MEIPDELLPREGAGREELRALYLADRKLLNDAWRKGNLERANTRVEKAHALLKLGVYYLQDGDKQWVPEALFLCCAYSLPVPRWCATAFTSGWRKLFVYAETGSWDDIFGKPYPKGTHISKLRDQWRDSLPTFRHIRKMKDADPSLPIDEKLFEYVGRELGVGGSTKVSEYYYYWKNQGQIEKDKKFDETINRMIEHARGDKAM